MDLPQLVDQSCAACGQPITSVIDGMYCRNCGNPAHHRCIGADATGLRDGRCACCGGDPGSSVAAEVRAAWGSAPSQGQTGVQPAAEPASEYAVARLLVGALRLMVALVFVGLLLQTAAIVQAAPRDQPGTTALAVLGLWLGGAAAMVVLLAVAETLRLVVRLLEGQAAGAAAGKVAIPASVDVSSRADS
jgi:hypothetical protein